MAANIADEQVLFNYVLKVAQYDSTMQSANTHTNSHDIDTPEHLYKRKTQL